MGLHQRKSLFALLDVLSSLLNEKHSIEDLEALELDLNVALSKMEKDFPATLQVCTLRNGLRLTYTINNQLPYVLKLDN